MSLVQNLTSDSEIPEAKAIREGSSSEGEEGSRWCLDEGSGSAESPRPVVISAWAAQPSIPLAVSSGFGAVDGVTSLQAFGSAAVATRTLVRRARVRGTVTLTSSVRENAPSVRQGATREHRRQPCPEGPRGVGPHRPAGPPSWLDAPARAVGARRQAEPLSSAGECRRLRAAAAIAEEAASVAEERRENAEARVLSLKEEVAAERAMHGKELARQAREAADRQAILQELDHDRTELSAVYRAAQRELSRLRAELSEQAVETLEIRRSRDLLERELHRRQQERTCVVCLDAPAVEASVPCGHLALCETCAPQLAPRHCPVCRRRSERTIRIYTP